VSFSVLLPRAKQCPYTTPLLFTRAGARCSLEISDLPGFLIAVQLQKHLPPEDPLPLLLRLTRYRSDADESQSLSDSGTEFPRRAPTCLAFLPTAAPHRFRREKDCELFFRFGNQLFLASAAIPS
jgi:hypothetical protein